MAIAPADVAEDDLLERLMPSVRRLEPDAYERGLQMRRSLRLLWDAFRAYPSILDEQTIANGTRSVETLVDALFRDGCDHTVLLPTKVAVGRGLMVARLNVYAFLLKICTGCPGFAEYREELQHRWETLVFSLLLEDVYQVIIESVDRYSTSQRRRSAIDLLHLWEHRSDRNVPRYAPIIVDLWRVRKRVAPVFGTMLGTIELLRISSLLSDTWHDFLCMHDSDTETIQALEEFVFGLTHEQISRVRTDMRDRHLAVVDRDALMRLFGDEAPLPEIESSDPREMYRFYQQRARSVSRRRIADLPGPRRTLEEILLMYLLERTDRRE